MKRPLEKNPNYEVLCLYLGVKNEVIAISVKVLRSLTLKITVHRDI